MKAAALPILILAAAGPAAAADGGLTVRDAVMRAVAPGVPNTAGYMTILNAGPKPDNLLSVSCACAGSVELHLSHEMSGKAMMMPSGPVEIPAGGELRFVPGSYHLMIMGLKAPLKDGSTQAVVLKFEHAGTLTTPFRVMARIPTPPARAAH
jgi:copper(I)-binding protein